MATGSVLDIFNRSLGSIGSRSNVQATNEPSIEAQQCNVFFTPCFESLARTAKWNCLKKQTPLSLVAAAPGTPENVNGTITPYPATPWYYSYLVPSDSLFIRQLLPPPAIINNTGTAPIFPVNNYIPYSPYARKHIPFEVALGVDTLGNNVEVINTNLSQAQAIYTCNLPNPTFWDSMFQQAMVASLAAYLVPALSLDKSLMGIQIKIAEGLIAQARAADGNESTISQSREASWIAARNGSSGPWGVGYNGVSVNFESMIWPG